MTQKFFKNAFWVGVVNLVLQLKAIVLVPLLSKKFGTIGYGAWSQVAVLVGILSPLLGIGVESGFSRFTPAQSRSEQVRSLWSVIWFQTIMAAFCAAGLWVMAKPLSRVILGGENEFQLVIVCGLVIYATLLLNDVKNFFRVVVSVRYLNLVLVIQGFGSLAVALTVFIAGGDVLKIVAFGALFDLLLALGCLAALAAKFGITGLDRTIINKFVSFGWVLLPTAYSMWILNLSDRLFLIHYNPLSVVGVYSVAYTLGYLPIQLVFNPIWMFFAPIATKEWETGNRTEIQKIFASSIKLAGFFIILVLSLMIVFYRPLMLLMTTRDFLVDPWVVSLICLAYSAHMIGSYGAVVLGLAGKPKLDTYTHFVAAGTNILLNALLIPRFGIYGAAASTCCSFGVQGASELMLAARYLRYEFPVLFLAKCGLGAAVLVTIERLLSVTHAGIAIAGVHVLLFSGLYALILFLMRAYSFKEIRGILNHVLVNNG